MALELEPLDLQRILNPIEGKKFIELAEKLGYSQKDLAVLGIRKLLYSSINLDEQDFLANCKNFPDP